jgi:hypothetical protein
MTMFLRLILVVMFTLTSLIADDKPSQEELDKLLAPIALYPDNLLAQTLMASTYPLEIVEAARWVDANKKLTGDALDKKLKEQKWDPSVQSMCKTPDVLKRLNDNLDWTQKLGNAFLADQAGVMDTVQKLRKKALDTGNLKSSKEMKVDTTASGESTTIIIQSPDPQVVYVPTYNPTVVYGTWWYPYPPYYIYPPAYVYPPGFGFTMGIFVGAWFWGGCHWGVGWGHSSVNININHYNKVNNVHINNNSWNHNSDHRKGVSYGNDNLAQKYNKGSSRDAVQSREAFRGKVDKGDFSDMGNFKDKDLSGARETLGNKELSGLKDKDFSGARDKMGERDFSGMKNKASSSGLSNIGNSARTNAISNRGSFSRGSGGHSGGGRSFGGRR